MVNTILMRRGFTLIELLIVIAILAILSTIGIGNFMSARIKAKDITRKSDLQTIAKSLEAYVNDHRTYPLSDINGKIICQTGNTICDWGTPLTDDKDTIYAATLPADVSGDYWYVSDGTSYSLYTHLENEKDPSIVVFETPINCGSEDNLCNYKISSSNVTP